MHRPVPGKYFSKEAYGPRGEQGALRRMRKGGSFLPDERVCAREDMFPA